MVEYGSYAEAACLIDAGEKLPFRVEWPKPPARVLPLRHSLLVVMMKRMMMMMMIVDAVIMI
jgi:hypothetical protein